MSRCGGKLSNGKSTVVKTFPGDGSTFPGDGSTFPGDGSTFPGDGSTFPGDSSRDLFIHHRWGGHLTFGRGHLL